MVPRAFFFFFFLISTVCSDCFVAGCLADVNGTNYADIVLSLDRSRVVVSVSLVNCR